MKEFLAEMACHLDADLVGLGQSLSPPSTTTSFPAIHQGWRPMQLLSTVKSGFNGNWRESFHILSSAHANFRLT
jgi:hypothetical protein